MLNRVIFCLIFIASSYVSLALNKSVFKVVAIHGNVSSSKTKGDLKLGDVIKKNAMITLGKNSYLGLFHNSGNAVEFYGKAIVKLDTIKFSNEGQQEINYDEFFLDKPLDVQYEGNPDIVVIQPLFQKEIYQDKAGYFYFEWIDLNKKESSQYEIIIKDKFDDIVYSEKKVDFSHRWKPLNNFTGEGDTYILEIQSPPSADSLVRSSETYFLLPQVLGASQSALYNDLSPMNAMLVGYYLERRFRYYELSREYYEKASKIAQYPEAFEWAFSKFIQRQNYYNAILENSRK